MWFFPCVVFVCVCVFLINSDLIKCVLSLLFFLCVCMNLWGNSIILPLLSWYTKIKVTNEQYWKHLPYNFPCTFALVLYPRTNAMLNIMLSISILVYLFNGAFSIISLKYIKWSWIEAVDYVKLLPNSIYKRFLLQINLELKYNFRINLNRFIDI